MLKLISKHDCCGCTACASICPKGCIAMTADSEGFYYPEINENLCINCGLCEKVCPLLHKPAQHTILNVYGAKNCDDGIRYTSSSGGMFTLFAMDVLNKGGVVFGAAFDGSLQVCHTGISTIQELEKLRGSKYVQSKMTGIFKKVRTLLNNGKKVLFSGTPCQIAGLKGFLMKDYENLTTVDVVCHGVPSAKVYNKYLQEIASDTGESITKVNFRDKANGWKQGETLFFTKTHLIGAPKRQETYMRLFLNNVSIRPSCGDCAFNNKRILADVTIADYWGIDKQFPEFDDDKGVTLVMINTEKGQQLFDTVKDKTTYIATDFEKGAEYNLAVSKSLGLHPKRQYFFDNLEKKTLKELEAEILPPV